MGSKRLALGLALVLSWIGSMGSAGTADAAFAITASGYEAPAWIALERGDVGEVIVAGTVVARFRSEAGGYTAAQRARIVRQRLAVFERRPELAREIRPAVVDGEAVVAAGDWILMTVDSATAWQNRTTRHGLVRVWANNLRRALGVPPLGGPPGERTPARPVLASRSAVAAVIVGIASWYGEEFRGRRTASGERFNPDALTAAHRTLPFGTRVLVTNLRNGRQVVVRINDRGPWIRGRVIDLSRAAARQIGISGVGRVRLDVLR